MKSTALFLALAGVLSVSGCQRPMALRTPEEPRRQAPVDIVAGEWPGQAIAYSGYRHGQSPEIEVYPSRDQVAEDLRILARTWRLIRVYKADQHGEDVLAVIRSEGIDLDVMLGIWLDGEPAAEAENAAQIEDGIRLANEYEDVVVAVNVGNEVLVEWTSHPVPEERVIHYVREVRGRVAQPVTVADNYVWWRDHGAALAREVDFITVHSYPQYERRDIDEGLSYTIENYEGVRAAHPGRTIVIGEAGWATFTDSNLNVPRAGDERKQRRYYRELTRWARKSEVIVFFFEAFDEPWKGVGTEGHWGLFTVDRETKLAMRKLYPERRAHGPTSPGYPEEIQAAGPDIAVVLSADLAQAMGSGSVNILGPGIRDSGLMPAAGAGDGAALRLAFTGRSWGGVYLIFDSYDASAARAVSMRLRVPEEVTHLELKLEGPASSAQTVNIMEHGEGGDASGWRTFTVPLSRFDGIDLSRLEILGLWNPADGAGNFLPCELLVDDIHFEEAGSASSLDGGSDGT